MLDKKQDQAVAAGGAALQAGGDINVITSGLTALEARTIAMDVAKATFYELSGVARDIAAARVEEITNRVIEKLEKEFPAGLQKAQDPDFQYSLLTVQKEFARNGDVDLGSLLVDLLVDRSKHDQRNILQIVLNESLATAPKLTNGQLAALAIIFLFKYTQNESIGNYDLFGKYLDQYVLPFVGMLPKGRASYQHLEFAGCGTVIYGPPLEEQIGNTYQGLFLNGFDSEEIAARNISIGLDSNFFIQCLSDSTKIQVNALNKDALSSRIADRGLSVEDGKKILGLFDERKMPAAQIKAKIIEVRSYMVQVFDAWTDDMQSFNLTSVGIAIGHANIKRFIGEFGRLEIWIN